MNKKIIFHLGLIFSQNNIEKYLQNLKPIINIQPNIILGSFWERHDINVYDGFY